MADARSKIPAGFDHIDRILRMAMCAADPETWPTRPHLGGPAPVLTARAQVDVALLVCQHARKLAADADELAFVDRMYTLTEHEMALPLPDPCPPGMSYVRHEQLKRMCGEAPYSLVGLVAKSTLRSAMHYRYAAPSAVGSCVQDAVNAIVQQLNPDVTAVRAFLAELDTHLVERELSELLAARDFQPSSPIARVLSRPASAKGASLGLVFTQLADQRYGLYVKLKQRWRWHEGDRDTMFAIVPDEYMEHVIEDIAPRAADKQALRRSRG